MPADINTLVERHNALKSDRATYDALCQELGDVKIGRAHV